MADDRYAFIAEWYDPNATIIRRYQFLYYVCDNSVEMYDIKNRRIFLKRSKCENITLTDLYVGSTINVHSRQLTLTDYADEYTRSKLISKKEKTLGMIKPDAISKLGHILDAIYAGGFSISKLKMCQLGRDEANKFYEEHVGKPFFSELLGYITSGPVVAFELMGSDAVNKWRSLLGPTDSAAARSQAPSSIRAKFGQDNTRNACHGSDSPESAARELEFFFPTAAPPRHNTSRSGDCTCCVIKPHAVREGQAGKIIAAIQESNFRVTAIQMFNLERANAEEFFEVYKGVVLEYKDMVEELTRGPCIALEVTAESAPTAFREMVGPADPEIARHLRPRTLRAKFGLDKVQNAVHCTDLPEDGLLEVEYFFKILDS
ncbi:nucleoside diphosphate kinase homolog 7-like [Lineus longissimus]|uniref:nucleoside diphosphate kinase homolog 7-like n=1 Tax=Lineus longissimus TaxID=88925 RepID=UPI002B4EFEFF